MARNRELLRQALASAAIVIVAALVAAVAADATTALFVLVAGALLALVFCLASWARMRKIASLAARLDEALASGRSVSFDDMAEGELAILASELDKTLARLSIANEDLEEERARLADSLADISHQLRTPLTSLGIELELIRRDAQSPAQRDKVMSAQRHVEQVQWLVSSLLKLARLDSGTVELTRQHVDVAELAAAAADPLAVSFDLAGVGLAVDIEDGCSFEGDLSWTREALANVLKNCLEHTPAGGTVSLSAWEDAIACRIRVSDTGPGISEEDLPHVFERFYHGAKAGEDRANPAGVGIGLSLARALILAQDGQITASNLPEGGACFDISFFKVVV